MRNKMDDIPHVKTQFHKIAFVAHEFGLYPGHGGIASYLYNISKFLLDNTDLEILILTTIWDTNCDLLSNSRIRIKRVRNDLEVCEILSKNIMDYVEVADYGALGLSSMLKKHLTEYFNKTIFAVHHHTASRECFEWNSHLPIKFASDFVKTSYEKERTQFMLADMQIAPSTFLAKYVKKNYHINSEFYVYNHLYAKKIKTQKDIINEVEDKIDITQSPDVFNILLISRFEGRKNQAYLIDQFLKFKASTSAKAFLYLAGGSNRDEITHELYRYKIFKNIETDKRKYIKFYNFLTLEQQEPLVSIANVCILPSPFENLPVSICEMVMRGIPCIVSKYCGSSDFFGSTKNSMTFDPFVKDDLKTKITNFWRLSREEQQKIADEQLLEFKKQTNPSLTVFKRFDDALNIRNVSDLLTPKNRIFRSSCNIIIANTSNLTVIDNFIVFADAQRINMSIIRNFFDKFKLNKNIESKILVFSREYQYIATPQNIIEDGAPFAVHLSLVEHLSSLDSFDVIKILIDNFEYIVQFPLPNLNYPKGSPEYINYIMYRDHVINFKERI